jgi:hypothetical protein
MTQKSDKSQVNIRMSSTLSAALKKQADYEGISLTELITRQAQSYLNDYKEETQPISGSKPTHPDSFLPSSPTRESLNFAQRLTTLERLLATGLDNIAIVNRLGTLECQLADAIFKLEKRLVALESRSGESGIEEPSNTLLDSTTTDYEALLSPIAARETHLAQKEQEQQLPPPPSEPDLDELSTQLAPQVAEKLAQQLTPISQLEPSYPEEPSCPDSTPITATLQQPTSLEALALLTSSPSTETVKPQDVTTGELKTNNSSETTTEQAASTSDTDSNWICFDEAFKYAQLQGYKGTREAFRMKSKASKKANQAPYARWKLEFDLARRGSRGHRTNWLRPTDPEHYRRLMGRFSGGTSKA